MAYKRNEGSKKGRAEERGAKNSQKRVGKSKPESSTSNKRPGKYSDDKSKKPYSSDDKRTGKFSNDKTKKPYSSDDKRTSKYSDDKTKKPYSTDDKRTGKYSDDKTKKTYPSDDNKSESRYKRPDKRSFTLKSDNDPEKKKFIKKDFKSKDYVSENPNKEPDTVRLNKYIATAGVCSRREADKYITLGLVSINGKVVKELGTKVKPSDKVTFNDQIIRDQRKVYILLNKPKGYVTTTQDTRGERIVSDLVKNCCNERIYPVGRLSKNSTGVLILTNDGELADQLTHPKYNKKKIFHVYLDKNIKKTDLERLVKGVELEDGFVAADAVSYADETDKTQVGIEIHSGKNKIVKRIFEHLGFKIKKIDRVYFAGLTKKGVQRGKWRFLNEKEIAMLKMRSYK